MVNIPLIGMNDFGMLEPTDIGNMTVDYDLKEDSKKKQRWDQDETLYMLQLIKENNLVNRYSMTRMSNILSELMLKKGYHRTDRQITQKLMTLRKNYLNYQQQKISNPYGHTKECPFYKELHDIYSKINNTANDVEDDIYETDSSDDYLIKFPNDNIGWQKNEVQKMLNAIKAMKLKTELTLTFFSPMAIKMIAESMQSSGHKRNAEQVKNALINLRTMYVNYKVACDRNENPRDCMFLPSLELFWNKEYRKCRLKRSSQKTDNIWSVEETIVLLTLIKDLNIAEEAYKNTIKAADKLRNSLVENGYSRTTQQIMEKLKELKTNFLNVHRHYADGDAIEQFHFYTVYKKLFEHQFAEDLDPILNSQTNTQDYLSFGDSINDSTLEESKVEVKLLLRTVREMTSKSKLNNSLEYEKLQRLRSVLKESGYRKTIEQIKHKLALLKNSYMKCNLDDSSEKDIFECPFYNELHDIFHTSVSDERYEFIQNLLTENLDLYESKFSDHSYTNTKFANSSGESQLNDKVTVIPNNKCLDNWFPVESIIDDNDCGISASSTLNFSLSGVSNKEQEQVIEDTFLATLPNSSDTKIEINPVIPDTIFSESKNTSLEDKIPPIIDDIALDQEVTAVNKEPDYSKLYRYHHSIEPEDADSRSSSVATTKRASSLDEEVQPLLKKPRIVEDERIPGKNKFLLKPVDSMDPSSRNVINTKFVRLIVANEPNKNQVNHITAHIEPLNVNTANSVSSGMSSPPIDRTDILKMITEKVLSKDDYDMHQFDSETGVSKKLSRNIELKISDTIKDAVQTMMKNDEFLQEKHHMWMEKQFEIQRKHDEARNNVIVNELKQLRNLMTVLIEKKGFDMK
ncbi:uncharacterized protein LOC131673420 isoform X2 [Phymastichus coffea]|uniref:uncharacterized protein LOC131673420 isoform X2 n=1 Tax=Phymastichus coffea TaxID=108790 RepID=UPI00273C7F05|nr:uncharacterized protein LOC131673420 isoform X2 [Phymastichus coffea]